MSLSSTFTERTVIDALPKPRHKVTAVATVRTQIGLELGDGHIILIHLHGDKDMLEFGYFFLDFLVDDNGTRMIHHHPILPLVKGNAMPRVEITAFTPETDHNFDSSRHCCRGFLLPVEEQSYVLTHNGNTL